MFLNTFYVLLLLGLGGVIGGGIALGRRVLGVTTRKAHLEGLKMDIEIDRLKHTRAVGAFQNQNQLLALTDGKQKAEDVPENVVVSEKDITEPARKSREHYDHHKMQQRAEDALYE